MVSSDKSGFGESLIAAEAICSFVSTAAGPEYERKPPETPAPSDRGDGPSDFELLADPPDFLFFGTSCSLNLSPCDDWSWPVCATFGEYAC